MKKKAVFFDIDGTLLDTHEYIYQAFEHSLGKNHKPLSREVLKTIMGKPLEECYRILTKLEEVNHLMKSHQEFQVINPGLVKPFPNTISTLEHLKEKGMLIAAITTRAGSTVKQTLDQTEISHYINYLVAFEDVVNPKPDPEGIRKALTYFEVKPEEAIMIGDSDVDVLAGQNAGVTSVGVTYGFHGKVIAELNPDYVIDDIKEVMNIVGN
jgi:pyrophosphatase PpaX